MRRVGKKDRAAMRRAVALARRVGIRLSRRPVGLSGEAGWDGHDLSIRGLVAADLCHEIAHWLVAPPRHRAWPEFGLGSSFRSRGIPTAEAYEYEGTVMHADDEEQRASLLGIAFMHALDMPWWPDTAHEHSWDADYLFDGNWWPTAMELEATKFLRFGQPILRHVAVPGA